MPAAVLGFRYTEMWVTFVRRTGSLKYRYAVMVEASRCRYQRCNVGGSVSRVSVSGTRGVEPGTENEGKF